MDAIASYSPMYIICSFHLCVKCQRCIKDFYNGVLNNKKLQQYMKLALIMLPRIF